MLNCKVIINEVTVKHLNAMTFNNKKKVDNIVLLLDKPIMWK
ncbi:hypothetical protein SAMN02745196_02730 [Clostridium collagenovorans DSM 3089]|uniref:Uncharacterized protein n=1 Tax=Clostridium collagenovorans DSM 3089 TaxID=1121306 RepID=A0A1M5Y8P1_9CLOT|nr:hypothetical protein [Clostridium collagenovorans]SHI08289.1 hypothetical protein SAMN02745196_02730 [Clostridium collagenovorans DSM 3089]